MSSCTSHIWFHLYNSGSCYRIRCLFVRWNQMCDVRDDMGKHLVSLTPSEKSQQIDHKQKSDSVTRAWIIEMKPGVWRTGGSDACLCSILWHSSLDVRGTKCLLMSSCTSHIWFHLNNSSSCYRNRFLFGFYLIDKYIIIVFLYLGLK
jgi:hypothetical protein